MTPHLKMPIPRSRFNTIFTLVITVGVVGFSITAMLNLLTGEDVVASWVWSSLWFGLLILGAWSCVSSAGNLSKWTIDYLGCLAGKHFAEIASLDSQPQQIRFGFELLGHRFVQRSVSLDKIESVEWGPEQARKYWNIALWFKHDDPTKRNEWTVKPDQDACIVGPSQRKEATEVLALAFVDFLRSAGVPLVRGKGDACFVHSGTH
jgi:hypothetical protein